MSTPGLPASRTEALSVVVFGVFSSLLGETPADDAVFGILLTAVANVWAITSSILTLNDIISESNDLETHMRLFMLGLLALTVVTSACALILLLPCVEDTCVDTFFRVVGIVVLGLTLVFDLVQLYLSYSRGCNEAIFVDAALCGHSSGHVLAAVILAGVLAVLMSWVIIVCSTDLESHSVLNHLIEPVGTGIPHSEGTALLTRTSAFVKVCLLSVYWFLVDPDMTWDLFMGHDASWWMTGQWAKQGVAIANLFLNTCT
ncbi:uncharacterized protein KRP23_14010 [Phytophthora ramorum]|uniref:uncharacterized protein n=1 Tax=Phytophthora ramorum TaxID=164328 RepID=UPI0030ACACD5|nr:hypothetical protein KRP23_14010 [Phytophthora ramorum]